MWVFEGEYTGEAKEYLKSRDRKSKIIVSIACFGVMLACAIAMPLFLIEFDWKQAVVIVVIILLLTVVVVIVIWLLPYEGQRMRIEITNNDFKISLNTWSSISFAFYKVDEIAYHDDFIVVNKNYVLQKDLLVEGTWEGVLDLLKKIEADFDSEDPMYQIEETKPEFIEATVKGKRIYKRFVAKVSWSALSSEYQYFITFALENGEELEFELGEDWYAKVEEGQTGTLVLMHGRFFSFGEGEEIQEETKEF